MQDWVALGGGNSGCCGDKNHTYGFHCPGYAVPVTDYSRKHEPGRPYDMSWACAGDFAHRGDPRLRAMHANVLARLMNGDPALSMVCEFIGQPWPGKPVYYWAAWLGRANLKRYTGSGHTTWSHLSWWRSRANQRAYLWTPAGNKPTPPPAPQPTMPAYPGHLMWYAPTQYDPHVKMWQARMRERGWRITPDGYHGNETRRVVLAFQKEKKLQVDGIIGPSTWAAAWTTSVT